MMLFAFKERCHYQQPGLTKATGLISGAVMVTVGVGFSAPAQANTAVEAVAEATPQYEPAQYEPTQYEPTQYETSPTELEPFQREQVRLEKLQRLQAGIAPERRISPRLTSSSAGGTADGVYLYGQQPVADQLATAYFVFEAQAGSVTGAFYMPSSSFDCVQGRIDSEQIALNVTDSYSQETTDYVLGLNAPNAQVASLEGAIAAAPSISGFHQLPVSDRDRALLSTCQARN